jgi:alanine racemase
MSRTATAILSTENLLNNITVLRKYLAAAGVQNNKPPAKIIAMVKANAYGHGIRSVSTRLDGHVEILGVASIDEALALRDAGVRCQIMLVEGVFEPNELLLASTEGFHAVFHEHTQVQWLKSITLPRPLNAWLKVNTGMGRLGFPPQECLKVYEEVVGTRKVKTPLRILSHFACADNKEHPLNLQQMHAFDQIVSNTDTEYSFCNSAAILHFPHQHHDFVRPGLALYGVHPCAGKLASEIGLKPVMTLQSSIIAIHHFAKGQSIGYGAEYICARDMVVGIIAFGYGDGYPVSARSGTPVLIKGQRCEVVGRVSMDMMTVDLSQCPGAVTGDQVILWGEGLPIEEIANYTAGITWSTLTGVQHRVKFLWTRP